MKKKPVKYIMGRLNLIAAYDDKYHYLLNSLKSNTFVNSGMKAYKYGTFNIEPVEVENQLFLQGTLTKFSPIEDAEKVNTEDGTIFMDTDTNNVVAKSNFVLHVKSGLIAFRPMGSDITTHAFRKHFPEIIMESNSGMLIDTDLQIISEENDVFESLKDFQEIHKIKVTLHPSNPSNRHIWKAVDDDLHEQEVEEYNTEYKSKKGLKVTQGGKIYSEIAMAADGYGKAEVSGIKDNEKKVASTYETPVKFDVVEEEGTDIKINKTILDKFKDIWERMKN